jgi:hypothetical protein
MDELDDLAGQILAARPTTRAGLRLQVLALISSWCEMWEDSKSNTVLESVASFCDVQFPPYLLPKPDADDEVSEHETESIIAAPEAVANDRMRNSARRCNASAEQGSRT